MSAWGTRRQLSFVMTFILLLVITLATIIALSIKEPTCTDFKQNQDELGIDCGGSCVAVCKIETGDPIVIWTRTFRVREGLYDVATYVENPNPFGATNVSYKIRIYDANNVPVRDLEGITYLNPNERTLILIPNVDVGFRIPTRAFIEFDRDIDWRRMRPIRKPMLTIINQKIEGTPILSIRAKITNESTFSTSDIEVYAVLSDATGIVLGASRTGVDSLADGESKEIVFTWPEPVGQGVPSAEIFARVNLVSGNLLMPDTVSK